jgi:NTE family protein
MLRALFERDITPDLILGTSVGALNGAIVATQPELAVVERLEALWTDVASGNTKVYSSGPVKQVRRAIATGTHLYSNRPLREWLASELGDITFEELKVPFQCVAASIEKAGEHWFSTGRVADAVVASAAVPGLLPPAEVDGEHFLDGGIVNSIPVGRAAQLGAERIFVLQVGRIERPLEPPTKPWQVARVSFEIARRHRFHHELASLPQDVSAHVLPAGGGSPKDDAILAYRDYTKVYRRIEQAYAASRAYLEEHL